jgi:RNA 2',3'-cyclic 3'-phosphodiesterase
MRLFVALDLDDRARQAIALVRQAVSKALDGGVALKWVEGSHLHLTLAFLGEIEESACPPIVRAFSTPIDRAPFDAVLKGLGVFPAYGPAKVLWVGIATGADDVIAVQQEVAGRCAGLGVMLEPRPFHPHLTLARWRARERGRRSDARRALAADAGREIVRFGVDHVTLYQSRLSQAGPTYVELARATLT